MRKILTIDGGGIRGVFPIAYLAALEDDIDEPIYKYFDLIAGTSTGGIIAIGLAMGFTAKEILQLYEEQGPKIFSQQHEGLYGWAEKKMRILRRCFAPKYSTKELENVLKIFFGEKRIKDSKTRLMIPAWNSESNSICIFKTAHHERFRTDYKELASDVAMATASAPTYFREFITARDIGFIDGGIFANNPTGIAVAEGITTLGWKPSEICVLSIGCLEDITEMQSAYGTMGLTPKLSGLFMTAQSELSLGLAYTLTGHVGGSEHKAIHRVDQPVPDKKFTLDDTSKIRKLKELGFMKARYDKPDKLETFFSEATEIFQPYH